VSYILWVNFRQPSVKRFALCYQTVVLSVCPVCGVGVLWPNGWMDQDETWHGGRPRPRPHCVRWGPSSPPKGAQPAPQFLAHVSCGDTARWMQMPLSMEVDLNPGDFVLDGDAAPPTERGTAAPSLIFGPLCSGTVAHLSNC